MNGTAYTGANLTYSVFVGIENTGEVNLSGVENKSVTIIKAGVVKLKATLKETDNYLGADRTITLTINKANQIIAFTPIADKLNTDIPFIIQANSTSGLPITISLKSGPATISGNTLTLTKELGNVVIEGKQQGNGNYLPATTATIAFVVTLDPVLALEQSGNGIQIWPIPTKRFLNVKTESVKISEISITDLVGKETLSAKYDSNEIQLDLENFSQGLYLIKISTVTGEIVRRIMKVN